MRLWPDALLILVCVVAIDHGKIQPAAIPRKPPALKKAIIKLVEGVRPFSVHDCQTWNLIDPPPFVQFYHALAAA